MVKQLVWRYLKKLELPYNPAISLLVIYPEKTETLFQKDVYISVFTVALVTVAKAMKEPK